MSSSSIGKTASTKSAVLDVVVLGIAVVVMNREGVHFTGLLEDTCPDGTEVNLLFVRFLGGVLGPHESGARVGGELRRRADKSLLLGLTVPRSGTVSLWAMRY